MALNTRPVTQQYTQLFLQLQQMLVLDYIRQVDNDSYNCQLPHGLAAIPSVELLVDETVRSVLFTLDIF